MPFFGISSIDYDLKIYLQMSILCRPISANLTHDTQAFERMDPYVKIYFGGKQFKTSTCSEGGRRPFWNDSFTLYPGTDTTLRIQVWDNDTFKDDLVGQGMYNLMNVYNMPGMRSENEYVDLIYKGRPAGRVLLSFTMQNMNNCWGQPTGISQMGYNQPMNNGFGMQPPMNGGWGQQAPMNNGFGMQPPMNNGWGQQPPPMNGGWGGNGMAPNNGGWGNNMPPPNNGWGNNNMPPPNNGWGW